MEGSGRAEVQLRKDLSRNSLRSQKLNEGQGADLFLALARLIGQEHGERRG